MVKRKGPDGTARSYATVTINGKTIRLSADGRNNEASVQNGQITIRSGDLTITGDALNLMVGNTPYDISKADVVAISVQGGRVKVDTSEGALATPVEMLPAGILTIHVDQQGQYRLGSDPINLEQLRARLTKTAQETPARIVLVQTDRQASHEDVVRILELCRREGLKNVSLLAKEPE
jgi:biopolymer transport protein ExbD